MAINRSLRYSLSPTFCRKETGCPPPPDGRKPAESRSSAAARGVRSGSTEPLRPGMSPARRSRARCGTRWRRLFCCSPSRGETAPKARITGVEIDAGVVRAARRWFDLDGLGVEVVKGDAQRYLERTRRRFDVILDDIFIGNRRNLRKPDWMPDTGLALAAGRLRPGGILVSNAIDEVALVAREMRRLFASTLQIAIEDYDNRVVVGAAFPLSGRTLRAALTNNPTLAATARRFKIRKSTGR